MSYQTHLKTTFIGKRAAAGGDDALETWTIGLRWDIVGAGEWADIGQEQSDAVAAACLPAAQAFFGESWHSNTSFFEEVRTYIIGPDGKSVGTIGRAVALANVPGSVDFSHPWQVALVASLVAEGRGVGKFGRVYLPGPAMPLEDDGSIAFAQANNALQAFKTFVTALDSALGTALTADIQLVVAGRTGAGTLRPVRQLRVGRILDTQRRRRRSLAELPALTSYGT